MINKKERFVPVLFLLKFWSQPQGLRAWEYRNSDARRRRYSLLAKPSRGSLQIPSLRPRSGAKVTLLHFLLLENHPLDGWFKRGYADEC